VIQKKRDQKEVRNKKKNQSEKFFFERKKRKKNHRMIEEEPNILPEIQETEKKEEERRGEGGEEERRGEGGDNIYTVIDSRNTMIFGPNIKVKRKEGLIEQYERVMTIKNMIVELNKATKVTSDYERFRELEPEIVKKRQLIAKSKGVLEEFLEKINVSDERIEFGEGKNKRNMDYDYDDKERKFEDELTKEKFLDIIYGKTFKAIYENCFRFVVDTVKRNLEKVFILMKIFMFKHVIKPGEDIIEMAKRDCKKWMETYVNPIIGEYYERIKKKDFKDFPITDEHLKYYFMRSFYLFKITNSEEMVRKENKSKKEEADRLFDLFISVLLVNGYKPTDTVKGILEKDNEEEIVDKYFRYYREKRMEDTKRGIKTDKVIVKLKDMEEVFAKQLMINLTLFKISPLAHPEKYGLFYSSKNLRSNTFFSFVCDLIADEEYKKFELEKLKLEFGVEEELHRKNIRKININKKHEQWAAPLTRIHYELIESLHKTLIEQSMWPIHLAEDILSNEGDVKKAYIFSQMNIDIGDAEKRVFKAFEELISSFGISYNYMKDQRSIDRDKFFVNLFDTPNQELKHSMKYQWSDKYTTINKAIDMYTVVEKQLSQKKKTELNEEYNALDNLFNKVEEICDEKIDNDKDISIHDFLVDILTDDFIPYINVVVPLSTISTVFSRQKTKPVEEEKVKEKEIISESKSKEEKEEEKEEKKIIKKEASESVIEFSLFDEELSIEKYQNLEKTLVGQYKENQRFMDESYYSTELFQQVSEKFRLKLVHSKESAFDFMSMSLNDIEQQTKLILNENVNGSLRYVDRLARRIPPFKFEQGATIVKDPFKYFNEYNEPENDKLEIWNKKRIYSKGRQENTLYKPRNGYTIVYYHFFPVFYFDKIIGKLKEGKKEIDFAIGVSLVLNKNKTKSNTLYCTFKLVSITNDNEESFTINKVEVWKKDTGLESIYNDFIVDDSMSVEITIINKETAVLYNVDYNTGIQIKVILKESSNNGNMNHFLEKYRGNYNLKLKAVIFDRNDKKNIIERKVNKSSFIQTQGFLFDYVKKCFTCGNFYVSETESECVGTKIVDNHKNQIIEKVENEDLFGYDQLIRNFYLYIYNSKKQDLERIYDGWYNMQVAKAVEKTVYQITDHCLIDFSPFIELIKTAVNLDETTSLYNICIRDVVNANMNGRFVYTSYVPSDNQHEDYILYGLKWLDIDKSTRLNSIGALMMFSIDYALESNLFSYFMNECDQYVDEKDFKSTWNEHCTMLKNMLVKHAFIFLTNESIIRFVLHCFLHLNGRSWSGMDFVNISKKKKKFAGNSLLLQLISISINNDFVNFIDNMSQEIIQNEDSFSVFQKLLRLAKDKDDDDRIALIMNEIRENNFSEINVSVIEILKSSVSGFNKLVKAFVNNEDNIKRFNTADGNSILENILFCSAERAKEVIEEYENKFSSMISLRTYERDEQYNMRLLYDKIGYEFALNEAQLVDKICDENTQLKIIKPVVVFREHSQDKNRSIYVDLFKNKFGTKNTAILDIIDIDLFYSDLLNKYSILISTLLKRILNFIQDEYIDRPNSLYEFLIIGVENDGNQEKRNQLLNLLLDVCIRQYTLNYIQYGICDIHQIVGKDIKIDDINITRTIPTTLIDFSMLRFEGIDILMKSIYRVLSISSQRKITPSLFFDELNRDKFFSNFIDEFDFQSNLSGVEYTFFYIINNSDQLRSEFLLNNFSATNKRDIIELLDYYRNVKTESNLFLLTDFELLYFAKKSR
jgi:hypothetical protein